MEDFMYNMRPFTLLIMLWTLPWKGIALWKAARLQQKVWFVLLLVLQTLGILEILYIFWLSKKGQKPECEVLEIK